MRISLRGRCARLGVSLALFVCALTWSSDSLATCGQHPGIPRGHTMTEMAHFEYASLIFGPDSARELGSPPMLGGFSCPGQGVPDSPPPTLSVPLRVEHWLSLASAIPADQASRPLFAVENRDRPRVCHTPIDRPPRNLTTV